MSRFWKISAILVAVIFVGVDNLVPRLDWAYVNFRGWLMYFFLLIPWTALLASPALLFGPWSRWFYYPLVVVLTVIESVTLFVRWQFKGQMNGIWVNIVADTTPREFETFLGCYFGVTFCLVTLLVVAFAVFACWTVSHLKRLKHSRRQVALGLACVGVFLLLTPFCSTPLETLESRSSVFFLTDAVRNRTRYDSLRKMKTTPSFPETLRRDERVNGTFCGAFVVGESATRSRWHLYGYQRQTTPRVEALGDDVIVFRDVTAAAIYTARALPLLLTTATLEQEDDLRFSLPQVLSHLDYETALFANQERIGVFSSSETYVFSGCQKSSFLTETATGCAVYDDALIPLLRQELSRCARTRPHVSFLHFAGSHSPAVNRYPADFNPFGAQPVKRSRDLNDVMLLSDHYDNSIAFTDRVLGGVVEELKCHGGPTWMVYLSDHGESPNEKSWRTGTSRDVWEIPMIVWLSPEYRRQFPDVVAALLEQSLLPLRSDHLLDVFLAIAGIKQK